MTLQDMNDAMAGIRPSAMREVKREKKSEKDAKGLTFLYIDHA